MRKKYSVLFVLLVLVGLYFGAKVYLTGLCRKEADATIARLAPYAAVRYSGISLNVFTMHTTLSDVTIATPGASESLRVQELVVNDIDRHTQVPQFLSVTLKGIAVDLQEGSELAENFKKLGYKDTIFYDVDVDYIYDNQKRELLIKKLAVQAKDVGRLSLELHLGNIGFDQTQLLTLLFTYPSILLADGKIQYVDDSLAKRIMAEQAKDAHQDIASYKKSIIASIKEQAGDKNDPYTKEVTANLEKFITSPDSFSISVAPEQPQPIGRLLRLQQPAVLLQLLRLHTSAS